MPCVLLWAAAGCGAAPAATQTPFISVMTAMPGASPTAAAPTSAPTRAPSNTPAASAAGATPASTDVPLATYTGSNAPFSVQYPADWTAADHEASQELVVISAPDQQSSLLLTYGSAGTLSTPEVLQTFLINFSVPSLKTSNQRKNADGSMSVDLQYNDSTGSPLVGLLRLVRQSTSANFYVIIFSATPDKFTRTKALGVSLLNSFQERTGSAQQTTPGGDAPSTPNPAPAADTPVPANTPPPTDTPRPVFTGFRIDAQARGYETWGAPNSNDGCNTIVTGTWNNRHPVKRLTIDITLRNDSSRPIQDGDISYSMVSSSGADLLVCKIVPAAPTAPPRGSSAFGLTTFVEQDQFAGVLRMTIFGSTVRICFGRNNPPSAVSCG